MRPTVLLLALLLAGCTQPTTETPGTTPQDSGAAAADPGFTAWPDPPSLQPDPDAAPAPEPAPEPADEPRAAPPRAPATLGTLAPGATLRWAGECPCEPVAFEVAAAGGPDEWLEIRVHWDGTQVADLGLRATVGQEEMVGERGFDGRRIQAWTPPAGPVAVALDGSGAFEATAALRSTAPPPGPRLPNLVTTVPAQVGLGSCDSVEQLEQGARRCLRLGNGVGNTGAGPLQVRLTFDQGALALGGQGRFVQEILQPDGTMAAHDVHTASFHPTHGHWHYEGVATFSLHALDPTGRRTGEVSAHHKAGFCLLDWDVLDARDVQGADAAHAEQDCLAPWTDGWTMGVSSGWYDFYARGLTDQYVDVDGLPDGLYELVSEADGAHTLDESDETDNVASVVVRLAGSEATVVEERGWYWVQPADL